jgi:hypothetical protein
VLMPLYAIQSQEGPGGGRVHLPPRALPDGSKTSLLALTRLHPAPAPLSQSYPSSLKPGWNVEPFDICGACVVGCALGHCTKTQGLGLESVFVSGVGKRVGGSCQVPDAARCPLMQVPSSRCPQPPKSPSPSIPPKRAYSTSRTALPCRQALVPCAARCVPLWSQLALCHLALLLPPPSPSPSPLVHSLVPSPPRRCRTM